MAVCFCGRQNDQRAAGSFNPPLRYHRNRERKLALQEPGVTRNAKSSRLNRSGASKLPTAQRRAMLATVQDAPRRLTPVTLRVIMDRACAWARNESSRDEGIVAPSNKGIDPATQLRGIFQKQRTKLDRRGSDDMTVWWRTGRPVSTMCKLTRVAQKCAYPHAQGDGPSWSLTPISGSMSTRKPLLSPSRRPDEQAKSVFTAR